jgi:hypothetical protein
MLPATAMPFVAALIIASIASDAAAQDVWAGAAVHHDTQRFDAIPEADRLDGAGAGWTVMAGARAWRHLAARLEWADGGRLEDVESLTLAVAGRTVTIQSTVAHRARAIMALGGFTHGLSSRAHVAYLVGAAFTRVERTFETNAPGMILGPSAPAPSAISMREDRFVALAGGVDAIVRLRDPVHAVAGLRLQRVKLDPEISGRSVRWSTGLAWVF